MATNPPGLVPEYSDEWSDEELVRAVEEMEQNIEREQQWEEEINDEELLRASGEAEAAEEAGQIGGGLDEAGPSGGRNGGRPKRKRVEGTFQFRATPFREQSAKKYGLKRTFYHLRLENPSNTFPVGHGNIVNAFEQGLADVINDIIEDEELPDHDRIQIYLGSRRLRNSHTSAHVSVEQWRDPMGSARQVLQNISNLLNSNENFEPDETLQLDVTYISMPVPGTGKPKGKRKRWCFGSSNYGDFLKNKRSVVQIDNKDDLCCGRAIVVAKAIVDKDPRLNTINNGRCHLQETLARELHREACVLPGPCGLDQIRSFEIVLPEYQFVVVSAEHAHAIVHKGPPSEKQIILLMHDGHFDVITKLPGFFDTSYFCLECEKGYSQEDYSHLSCKGKKCDACYQKNCRDYELFRHEENPQLPCKDCNRKFYGVTCQLNHLTMKANGQTVGPSERNVCRSQEMHCLPASVYHYSPGTCQTLRSAILQ